MGDNNYVDHATAGLRPSSWLLHWETKKAGGN